MNKAFDIGIIGAGAWGTALAILYAHEGKHVALWARDASRAQLLQTTRENPHLPGIALPSNLHTTAAIPTADLLLLAVPMQHARETLQLLPPQNTPLVLCCKGLEHDTLLLPHELAATLHPRMPTAILTGPNFAHEIARALPAAAVLATPDPALRHQLVTQLRTPTLRLYASPDITGAALGGAAKNVIAIAAGIVIGAGLGENARAALITRGIAEIARLTTALGGLATTSSGLSGLGDLLLTCTGTSSRNYSLGFELGQNTPLSTILAHRTSVTEGIATAPALLERGNRAGVDMPITEVVTAVLAGDLNVKQSMEALMRRVEREE